MPLIEFVFNLQRAFTNVAVEVIEGFKLFK